MNHAVRTAHPYLVQSGDSLTFWCWYNLESNYDVAVVEVSENTKEWFCLDDRYSGNSGGWVRKAYSLEPWVGKSLYFRFRSMTDGNTLATGFYVDDIYPTCLFQTVTTVSSSISDTSYTFTGHPEGIYYYYVRGNNTTYGWGDYSCLERANVIVGVVESDPGDAVNTNGISVFPNPFSDALKIDLNVQNRTGDVSLKIYSPSGRLVKSLTCTGGDTYHIVWHGEDEAGRTLPAGVYFVKVEADNYRVIKKITLLR